MARSGNKQDNLNRKDFLRIGGLFGAASLMASCSSPQPVDTATPSSLPPAATATPSPAPTQAPGPELAVRIAHITDMHILPEGVGREQFSRALRSVQSLDPPVNFVLNTGDCVMDVLFAEKESALEQWDAFQSVLSADFPLPVYHAIGNHDVWGWGLGEELQETLRHDPLFGKQLAIQRLGMTNPYYAFDHGGWHFIVLDSVHPREIKSEHPYTGKLDDEQYDWLVSELETTPSDMPVCIASHIPIFGACGLMDSSESSGNWVMPGAWQHIDGRRLIDLFWKHRNIQLCLSGHTHQLEDLRYHGLKYLTNGAISGNWWAGEYHDFPPAYVIVNLYQDGSSTSETIYY
jgi:3',5'-cyclic AMP phosphodiesterase CpdA